MKKIFSLFLPVLFLLISCKKDDEPTINPLPDMYHGMYLQVLASRSSGSANWSQYSYLTIYIGNDGNYYSLGEGGTTATEGSINWFTNSDGVQKFHLTNDDGYQYLFTVNEYDENHLLMEIDWGGSLEEWLFITGRGNLAGVITQEYTGQPLQNAIAILKNEGNTIASTTADVNGYFVFDNQTPNISNANKLNVYMTGCEDKELEVYVEANTPLLKYIEMNEGTSGLEYGMVSGEVSSDLGSPLEGVTISYGSAGNDVQTDALGVYEIMVPEGSYTITANLDGYDEESQSVNVESLGSYDIDFTLSVSGCDVGGSVTTASGTNVSGASLDLKNESGTTITNLSTGADGTFSFEGIQDGIYTVSISAPGMQFVPVNYPVVVSGGNVSDVHFLALEEGKTGIGGQITHADDDSPIASALITARDSSTMSDANGYFILELPSAGADFVKGEKTGFINSCTEEDITAGELSYCDIDLTPASSGVTYHLEGYVMDMTTAAVLGDVTINVVNNAQTTTNTSGYYSVDITIYDDALGHYFEVLCSKTGYITQTTYFAIYRDVPSQYNIMLESE